MASITMKVPVLPTPALRGHKTTQGQQQRNKEPLVLVFTQDEVKRLTQIRGANSSRRFSAVPAVDRYGPSERWIDGLDLFEELQHADGRERNSKVRPAGEMELGDRSGGLGCLAGLLETETQRLQMEGETAKLQRGAGLLGRRV